MNCVIDFFELVLKKDHHQKDNPLYKAREKLDKILEILEGRNLSEEDRIKNEDNKKKAKKTLEEEREKARNKLIPEWIENFALKSETISSKPINWGTHLSKFENAMNDYGCINSDHYQTKDYFYISTSSINHKTYDVAHSNGNQINFSRFLILKDDNQETVFEKILRSDLAWLDDFISNEKKKLEIISKLKLAITTTSKKPNPAQHKQVYFPISFQNDLYHVVSPIFSSTFCQHLFSKMKKPSTIQKSLRKANRNGLYARGILVDYPKVGVMKMGGDKPHNISPLNSNRFGQLVLLPAAPPQWKTQLKPPTKTKTIFNRDLGYQAKEPFEKLRKLLLAIKFNELSVNLHRKRLIAELITEIADVVFDRVAQIHRLIDEAGWSLESNLPIHQQYWLDPFKKDQDWQTTRADVDWQTDISCDFAKWVNRQLKHPKLTIGVVQERHWRKLFVPLLREFNAITETSLKETVANEEEIA
jgi:CRISPR-associated protein Csy1